VWLSKQQTVVAPSTTLAEIIAAATGTHETDRLISTLKEIGVKSSRPVMIRTDNKPAINLLRDDTSSSADKHVEVKYHVVREKLTTGEYDVSHVATNEMVADIFTKALARPAFEYLRKRVGLRPEKLP
jgi:hypothetical protein